MRAVENKASDEAVEYRYHVRIIGPHKNQYEDGSRSLQRAMRAAGEVAALYAGRRYRVEVVEHRPGKVDRVLWTFPAPKKGRVG